MTDPETSGAPANPAPAETAGAPKAAESTPQFGAFGSTRGSGLARGKRTTTAASTAPAATGEYKPTAIEVVVPQREYRNPFGDPPAPMPAAAAAPIESAAPVLRVEPIAPPVSLAAPPAPAVQAEVSAAAQIAFPPPIQPAREEIAEKAELNILPPAELKRPPVHWGTTPAPRAESASPGVFQTRARREEQREEKSSFKPEPRREQGPEGRDPRHEHRRHDTRQEPRRDGREAADHRGAHHTEPVPAHREKGGFIAWLKNLFAPRPPEQPAQAAPRQDGDGQFQRRRRRGGRNRHRGDGQQGQSGPPREDGQSGFRGGQPDSREGRPDFHGGEREGGGHRRRRHRGGGGGRGRDRGDSRPEGWQGGGAI